LHGVSCSPAGGCFAVGYHQRRSGTYATLTERWTGQRWTVQPSPNPGDTPYADLNAITCVGSGRCLAVGNYFAAGSFVPLGETWTGSEWQVVAGPGAVARPSGISYLDDVACTASLSCLAVGATGDPANLDPLSQRWNLGG
jgi:hypothetical protein